MAARKKSKQPRRKTAGANANGLRPQLVLAGVVLTILTLAALLLVRGPVVDPARPFATEDLAVEIESVLLRGGLTLEQVEIQHRPDLVQYTIRSMLSTALLDRLQTRLQTRFPGIVEDHTAATGEVSIYHGGALVATLQFERGEPVVLPPPPPVDVPRVAIIMDDLGRSLAAARQLIDLDLSVTLAILPGEPLATEVALLASRSGQEVMIHIPMEPQDYPHTNPGRDALLLGQSEPEIRQRLATMMKRVPYAAGANNHMGSRYTEYRDGMRTVLAALREHGLFFVDSRTTSRSIVKREADRVGVPTTTRDVFLDNVADVEAIRTEIRRLIKRARKNGTAVGICHPYPETLAALRLEREGLQDSSIELVFASKLVSL